MQANSIIPSDLHVDLIEGKPMVSSLDVARVFDKRHDSVLRGIRDLLKNWEMSEFNARTDVGVDQIADEVAEFNASNFGLVEYTDAKGERRPAYNMTKDGFTLLVMGYTGERAMRFKIAYINEFNRKDREINALREELHKKELDTARKEKFWDSSVTAVMVKETPQKAINRVIMGANMVAQCSALPTSQRQAFGKVVQQLDRYFKLK